MPFAHTASAVPATELGDNPALIGSATWRGRLVGLTPDNAAVASAARLAINLDSFAAGLIMGPDVMRPIMASERPRLACVAGTTRSAEERQARHAEEDRRKREEDRRQREQSADDQQPGCPPATPVRAVRHRSVAVSAVRTERRIRAAISSAAPVDVSIVS